MIRLLWSGVTVAGGTFEAWARPNDWGRPDRTKNPVASLTVPSQAVPFLTVVLR